GEGGSGFRACECEASEHEGRGCSGEDRQSGASARSVGGSATELKLHGNHRTGGWRGDPQAGRAGTDRAGRARAAGGRAARERVGDGELPGNAIEGHEAGTKGGSESGYLWKNVQRACGLHRRSDGVGVEPAAAGKCDWQLRESGPAHSGEDCSRSDSVRAGRAATWNERGRDGDHAVSGNKAGEQNGRRLNKRDRKSTRLNSSHVSISYAVFC